MDIKVFYSGKDFFGHFDSMLECTRRDATEKDLQTAFRKMGKDRYCALHLKSVIAFWDSPADFDNGIITIRVYRAGYYYEDMRLEYSKARKQLFTYFKQEAII